MNTLFPPLSYCMLVA